MTRSSSLYLSVRYAWSSWSVACDLTSANVLFARRAIAVCWARFCKEAELGVTRFMASALTCSKLLARDAGVGVVPHSPWHCFKWKWQRSPFKDLASSSCWSPSDSFMAVHSKAIYSDFGFPMDGETVEHLHDWYCASYRSTDGGCTAQGYAYQPAWSGSLHSRGLRANTVTYGGGSSNLANLQPKVPSFLHN